MMEIPTKFEDSQLDIPIKFEELQLDLVCRICLLEKENMKTMSEEVSAKLAECASVQDSLLLCTTCENEIKKWHSFKQQVTRTFELCKALSQISKDSCLTDELKSEDILEIREEYSAKCYKHKCVQCSEKFQTHGQLRTHLKMHKMEEGYTCDICSKVFRTSQILWKHKKLHTANKLYPCTKCEMAFPFKYHFDRHFQAKHMSDAKFACSYCPKKYKVKETLVSHVKKMHVGDGPHTVCNYCGKCVSLNSLKVHVRSHTGERPFACNFCKKGFVTKDHLTLHQRIHTGERPYVCSDCGKKFISCSVLNKHRRSHTGEKPYRCHLCDKRFSLSSGFKAHLKCH